MILKKGVVLFAAVFAIGCTSAAWVNTEWFDRPSVVELDLKGNGEEALPGAQTYYVGVGIGDATEYPSGQLCGGYVESSQKTEGIFTRQRARAFVIADSPDGARVAIVVVDDWAVSLEMRAALIEELAKSTQKTKDGTEISLTDSRSAPYYHDHNVLLNATHTHTGVMGDAQRHQYNISAGGYNENLMMITVRAAVEAIAEAHANLEPCTIEFSKGKLIEDYNVSKNRSFTAHLNNEDHIYDYDLTPEEFDALPTEEEKEAYRLHEEATDKMMYLLRFRTADGRDKGALNWYSVHPTSISASFGMISGDSKGFAAQIFESMMGVSPETDSGFVAGFAQSALGDVDPCRTIYYRDKFGYSIDEETENGLYSARAQAAKAMELYSQPQVPVRGEIAYATQWVSMDGVFIDDEFAYMPETYPARTWPPATGWSMAKGAEINQVTIPSGFYEGMSLENEKKPRHALFPLVHCLLGPYKNLDTKHGFPKIFNPSKEYQAAHFPKPILMASGNADPSWMDTDLPFQIFRIGNIAVMAAPFETTTVSGRRLRERVFNALEAAGTPVDEVIYCGNSNAYVGYMATPEEYRLQHYEGASTAFGINQVPACEQEFTRLAKKLAAGKSGRLPGDPAWIVTSPRRVPADKIVYAKEKKTADRVAAGKAFGEQVKPLEKKTYCTGETFSVEFHAARLNTEIFHNDSYFYIQRLNPEKGIWVTTAIDDDYETNLLWKDRGAGYSRAQIIWRIPFGTEEGVYRVVYKGAFKKKAAAEKPEDFGQFCGVSEEFEVKGTTLAPISASVVKEENQIRLLFENEAVGDLVVIRLKEGSGAFIDRAEIDFGDGKRYPLSGLTDDGRAVSLPTPDRKTGEVTLRIFEAAPNAVDAVELFEFYNTEIENRVKKFEPFCT